MLDRRCETNAQEPKGRRRTANLDTARGAGSGCLDILKLAEDKVVKPALDLEFQPSPHHRDLFLAVMPK